MMSLSAWFASFFRHRVTPVELLARYKEILAAILPDRYLTEEGLLRKASGEGEAVEFEVRAGEPPAAPQRLRYRSGFVENTADRVLKRQLQLQQEPLVQALAEDIGRFATEHFHGDSPTRIVLCDIEDGVFLHEVFHDIQGYLYDNHPAVHQTLLDAVMDSKPRVVQLYAEAPTIRIAPNLVMYPRECRWMEGYKPNELFPADASLSPYHGFFNAVVERFGWQTLFKIRAVADAAAIEMGNQEVIPTLLSALVCGDMRVLPVLEGIFARGGLNRDFHTRLLASKKTLRFTQSAPSTRATRPHASVRSIEHPAEVLTLFDDALCGLLPSFPGHDRQPAISPADGWCCPKCGTPGVHVVLTNVMVGPMDAFHDIQALSWRKRTIALDALVCRRHWSDHLESAAFPLLLNDATISDLRRLTSSLRLQGQFDLAEISSLRMLNSRPGDADAWLGYVNVLLDRLKCVRLCGQLDQQKWASDREACVRLAGESLASARAIRSESHAWGLVTAARLALETGDVTAARKLLSEAKASAGIQSERDEVELCEKDLCAVLGEDHRGSHDTINSANTTDTNRT